MGRRASELAEPRDLRGTAPQPTPKTLEKPNHCSRLSYIAAALAGSPGTRVAIAAIATDHDLVDEDIVAAVAGTQDAQTGSSSGDEDRLDEAAATRAYSADEVAVAFGLIRRFCGDMK
ncbi:hypothetical protein HPB52_021212 [Rhipicephalus sanguineus]|uniref:Uncharacterized protein n=1 Tax=Rhipicephalus sanguineus TaxID=34632 RepID=A0A9D4Q3J6_RHISA|nr:hypothetical protein HPB52_021212 [Rhipicephalus sanguineus]